MRTKSFIALAGLLLISSLLFFGTNDTASARSPRLVSAFGKANIGGQELIVHTVSIVPRGENPSDVARESLAAQGARPISSAEFTEIGLKWTNVVGDARADALFNYIESSTVPDGVGDTVAVRVQFANALVAWADLAVNLDANLEVPDLASATANCPSLVRECDGKQFSDGSNDVGWVDIKGKNTLGVTWFTSSEADIALDINQPWFIAASENDDGPSGTHFDIRTVVLHEFGHGLGLGHEQDGDTVMNATYGDVAWWPGTDDIAGIQAIYGGTGSGGGDDPATDPVPVTTMTVVDITTSRSGPRGRDLIVRVEVDDNNGDPVANASEWIQLFLDGSTDVYATGGPASTDSSGVVRWRLRNAPSGSWDTNVFLVKEGLLCETDTDPVFSCNDGAPPP